MVSPVFQSENYVLARNLLDAASVRQEAVAANIANADTPGYRRVDLAPDFAAQLKSRLKAGDLASSDANFKPQIIADPLARSVRPDGNSVNIEHELLVMNRNQVEHEYLTNIISQNIKQLKMAITGRQS